MRAVRWFESKQRKERASGIIPLFPNETAVPAAQLLLNPPGAAQILRAWGNELKIQVVVSFGCRGGL